MTIDFFEKAKMLYILKIMNKSLEHKIY